MKIRRRLFIFAYTIALIGIFIPNTMIWIYPNISGMGLTAGFICASLSFFLLFLCIWFHGANRIIPNNTKKENKDNG